MIRVRAHARLALVCGGALLASCVFAPNIAPHGYVTCSADADCEPGRTCDDDDDDDGPNQGVCAPPPWHDETYGDRRVLVVTNESATPMLAGTAVPVLIGGEGERAGLLSLADVGADFRVADFDTLSATWSVRTVHLDRESDRFTAWIPLARDVPQGRSDVLAWIESDTFDEQASVAEDPVATFALFDGFEADALDEERWVVRGDPTVSGGTVNVGDNESIVLARGTVPPVHATAVVRINGVGCDEVFVGFTGDDDALFAVPPAAGLFVDGAQASARIGPDPQGQLQDRGSATTGGAFLRVHADVDGAGVRVAVDDTVVLDEAALVPPFPAEPLFFAVQVGGACSVDVDAIWITPLPLPAPSVVAGPLVELAL